MPTPRTALVTVLVAAMSLVACDPTTDRDFSEPAGAGGTFRHELTSLPFDRDLDPTSEYTSLGFAVHSNLLLRPLMNYKHVGGPEGNEVLPDLAERMPVISDGGTTYTFTLDPDARFGPPINRRISSRDVEYAFERLATPETGAQYAFYFSAAIEGLGDFMQGSTDSISGIETPTERSIVFHLVRPTGDFLYRLAMPAAAPIPHEIAGCFSGGPGYGQNLIASGPYMIEGSDDQSFESCEDLDPFSGFDPQQSLTLVRNPNFERGGDDARIRESLPDRFEFEAGFDHPEILDHVEDGRADLSTGAPSLDTLRRYASIPRLRDNLHVEPGDRLWYISMNLTLPPFDDVHVRRAVNFVMDRDSLVRAWGGPLQGDVATHMLPDNMLEGALKDFAPFASRDSAGDVAKAKAEMKLSGYDANGDGLCDADVCSDVVQVSRPGSPWDTIALVAKASLLRIGIELDNRELDDPYSLLAKVPNRAAITSVPGWGKDYPDPFAFLGFLFDGRNIDVDNNTNYSLVGLTRERAMSLGIPPPASPVPSVDEEIDACTQILERPQRQRCWADVDRFLTWEVAPWVPYLDANQLVITSDAVRPFEFDQFSGEISYAHVGIRRGSR